MTGPYERFLACVDVEQWSACLDELMHAVEATRDDEVLATALAQGLCVGFYLRWLARSAGDYPTEERTGERVRALRARALAAGAADSAAWRLCRALLLATDGYPVHARALLGEDGIATAELAVLLVGGDDVARLVGLRGFVRGSPPTTFLPAVYEYVSTLVNVGALSEAQHVLATGDPDEDDPLLIELRGSIHERLGQWTAAYAQYRRSPWPEHRYRGALVGTISGQWAGSLDLDQSIQQVLLRLDGELDRAGTNRNMAFLHACLWQEVESWILELELGRLCFRRRQFAEADLHFARALLTAPEAARYPIADLRFTNLTWLTGDDQQRTLDLLPESLAVGAEAVRLGGYDERTAATRLWIARLIRDTSLIPPSVAGWTAHDRAMAYDIVGAPVPAIDALIDAVETTFNHRAVCALMNHLHAAGFLHTVVHLAEVVLSESNTDFARLWETCESLQRLLVVPGSVVTDDPSAALHPPDGADAAEDELRRLTDRYCQRLVELSQFEFMNAMRACQVANRAGYADQAEELLLRAAKQAESVSELVAVAVQRRGFPRSVRSDQEALRCLAKARGLARDRRERLEIARELFCYGAVRDGRALLEAEGALSVGTPLTHSEMTVVLQCASWCTDDERRSLVVWAAQRLARDEAAGVLGPYPEAYGRRLADTVYQFVPSMVAQVDAVLGSRLRNSPSRPPWPVPDEWSDVDVQLTELSHLPDEDTIVGVGQLCATESFGRRLLVVKHLRGELTSLQEEARRVLPTVSAPQVPVDRWYDDLDGPRVFELCDLWRSRILSGEPAELTGFLADEPQLTEEWEQQRREASAPVHRKIVLTADLLHLALSMLLDAQLLDAAHPILRGLFTAMRHDVERLTTEAADQAATARQQLDSSPRSATAETVP